MSAAQAKPERRLNLLTGDWVLVSPHRMSRPWQGAVATTVPKPTISHDPACYLCPGVKRAEGAQNPDYQGVYVFDNDFPALLAPEAGTTKSSDPLLVAEAESGICRVICYSPDHSRTMAQMPVEQIASIIDVWADEYVRLAAKDEIGAVTIFENRGEMMGASNPHPHGQIWATKGIPNELAREDARQADWHKEHGEALLASYLRRELETGERVIVANDSFVALLPFWAAWPFETLVLPRRSVASLDQLTAEERLGLADVLGRLTSAYDALFDTSFPYTMGIHQAPTDGRAKDHFTLHMHFYPPLLRSATVRKFMVGFEMLAMPQRDLTPESAAERLRSFVK